MSKEQFTDKQAAEEKRKQKLAAEVVADFQRRREQRRGVESGWLLNMRFYSGDQYCDVSPLGGVVEENDGYYWQSRRVFNHIAPLVDSRIAKLEKLRPVLRVRAFSDEEGDVKTAKLATGVLQYAQSRIAFAETVSKATVWSETCGSAFYKVTWNEQGGKKVGVDEVIAGVLPDGKEEAITIGAVTGILEIDDSITDCGTVLNDCTMAMNIAKHVKKTPFAYASKELKEMILRRNEMIAGFPDAIQNRELQAFYQPKVKECVNYWLPLPLDF